VIVAHSPANAIPGATPRVVPGTPVRVGYIGSMYPGRGVDLVIRLAAKMPAHRFELVGGSEDELARLRGEVRSANVTFHGFLPPAKLPALTRELDVLLMPYPHAGVHGPTRRLDTARYCSPMKMFEYMASGVPIVASDLPVLGEVLVDGDNALIAPFSDELAWQRAIERLVAERGLRERLATRALADLARFTPQARVTQILRELAISP
jgi:glycosyltransferase involved in cell wall biosynthesis